MRPKLVQILARHVEDLRGQRLVAAISGGADSTALLMGLSEIAQCLNLKIIVAHLDHGIRGEASEADARWVRDLANKLHFECYIGRARLLSHTRRRHGDSLEMVARKARYRFLIKVAHNTSAKAILTAHTADDQAETVLIMLSRGCGPAGLSGIPRESQFHGIRIIRPLLSVTREEIVRYLKMRKVTWREDRTNKDISILRNRVRHKVLPFLARELNPSISKALCRTADILRSEETWIQSVAEDLLTSVRSDNGALRTDVLCKLPSAARKRVLKLWLTKTNINVSYAGSRLLEDLSALAETTSPSVTREIRKGIFVRKQYGTLRIVKESAHQRPTLLAKPKLIKVPGTTLLPDRGLIVSVNIAPGVVKERLERPGLYPARASLALKAASRRIFVRSRRPGDRMFPLGLKGSKKIQDIFVDTKVPVHERNLVPIFVCDDEIIWLPGYRIAGGWEVVTPESNAVQIEVCDINHLQEGQ